MPPSSGRPRTPPLHYAPRAGYYLGGSYYGGGRYGRPGGYSYSNGYLPGYGAFFGSSYYGLRLLQLRRILPLTFPAGEPDRSCVRSVCERVAALSFFFCQVVVEGRGPAGRFPLPPVFPSTGLPIDSPLFLVPVTASDLAPATAGRSLRR